MMAPLGPTCHVTGLLRCSTCCSVGCYRADAGEAEAHEVVLLAAELLQPVRPRHLRHAAAVYVLNIRHESVMKRPSSDGQYFVQPAEVGAEGGGVPGVGVDEAVQLDLVLDGLEQRDGRGLDEPPGRRHHAGQRLARRVRQPDLLGGVPAPAPTLAARGLY